MTPPVRPESDLDAKVRALREQGADDDAVHRFLTEQMGLVEEQRPRPRGYRTPEQIARLNKNDMDAAKDELGPWETIAGGLQAAGQGLTLGFGDEIAAGLRTPLSRSGDYKRNLADVRAEQGIFSAEHPKAATALNVAGAALVPARGIKQLTAMGATAGAGYAGDAPADRAMGALGGGTAALATGGVLGAGGALVRGTGKLLRSALASPSEKAMAYLQKLAEARSGGNLSAGLKSTTDDIASARAVGGQPILAEGLGESGLRALKAATTAPLSQAGETVRASLGTRGSTVLPRADEAALGAVGLKPQSGVRGPEYVNDWLDAIRTDKTKPLYAQAEKEAVASAGTLATRSAPVKAAKDLVDNNAEVRALINMLKSDPEKAALMADPTSYEAMEAIYHAANSRIRDLTGGTLRSRVQERALKNIATKFLSGMEALAPTAKVANKAFAELSQPQKSFVFGKEFDKITPETLDKAIQTGVLPEGGEASIESIRLGVVQRLRELLTKRAGSQSLLGDAKGKDALASLNNEQLNRQLRATLGDKYDEMVPVIRQLLREEGTRMYATGGKNVAEGVIPEGANLADVFGAFSGGLGFGAQAAARRTAAAALKGGIKERIAIGFGKGADERAKMLTSQGQTLDDFLRQAAQRRPVPWEQAATKYPKGVITRGITAYSQEKK